MKSILLKSIFISLCFLAQDKIIGQNQARLSVSMEQAPYQETIDYEMSNDHFIYNLELSFPHQNSIKLLNSLKREYKIIEISQMDQTSYFQVKTLANPDKMLKVFNMINSNIQNTNQFNLK